MKKTLVTKIVVGAAALSSTCVFAADETGAGTSTNAIEALVKDAFDQLTTLSTSMSTQAWGLVVLIVGSTVGIKLFKKFVNRAS